MRRFGSILMRLVFTVLLCVSGFLLLESPVIMAVPNVPQMAKTLIQKSIDQSDNDSFKGTYRLAKELGVEDKILEQLPRKYHQNISYVSMYNLSVTYRENGELTAKNLALPANNKVQEAVNYVIINNINDNLKKNKKDVNQTIAIFHYCFFGLIILFAIAIILVLFGRWWASIAILLATVGSFGALQFYSNNVLHNLQTQYHGITLTTSSALWLGLAIGLVALILWPPILKITKKNGHDN
ncbi:MULTISPECIES: hypothetical protein [unclassified Lactobacillus]|uniref:hypothetical protein n=1 Tax=unclassified Lactobacillus TaxID=2620435 RepID=UPI000EFCD5FC|nr:MULTISPECIES: hypothetical protein [unclassified Lactobacillus]RMC46215.1 hypothetical protein F5ESL0230_02870 [Lactobacillus sp. ESL0230]RMC51268.1 hypothetical protein F5ESL0225_02645 [Lactobacillus sp. ESL0225]